METPGLDRVVDGSVRQVPPSARRALETRPLLLVATNSVLDDNRVTVADRLWLVAGNPRCRCPGRPLVIGGFSARMASPEPRILIGAIRRHFRELLEAAPDAMVIVDGAGVMLLVNRQTERLFGYARHELLGRPVEALMPERFRQRHDGHRAGYARDPVARPMGTDLELFGLRKDGSEFPTEISLSPVDTQKGRLVIAAVRDVTERKRAEEERRVLLGREQAARLAAEQANQARDDVLAVVSHDLQNLLNAVTLNLAVLLRTPASSDAEKRMRRSAEVVDRSVGAMIRLLRDILEAQRMEGGPLRVTPSSEDVAGIVREVVELMASVAEEKRIRLDEQLEDQAVEASCERERVQQVLTNLIGNAIHFTPAGGRVAVRVWRAADESCVAIADGGPGIPAEQRPRVFDRYWRGRGASRQGIGLGLFIVKGLVEAHGGSIWVEDTPGGGATFVFTLPAASGPR
jgi:protein-histidine pros-kinase